MPACPSLVFSVFLPGALVCWLPPWRTGKGGWQRWIQAPSPWIHQPCPRPLHPAYSCPAWAWGVCLAAPHRLMRAPVCRRVCVCAHACGCVNSKCSYCWNSHKIHASRLGITTFPFVQDSTWKSFEVNILKAAQHKAAYGWEQTEPRVVMVRAAGGQTPSWGWFAGALKGVWGCALSIASILMKVPQAVVPTTSSQDPLLSLSCPWVLGVCSQWHWLYFSSMGSTTPSAQAICPEPLPFSSCPASFTLNLLFSCCYNSARTSLQHLHASSGIGKKEHLLGTVASLHLKIHFKMPVHLLSTLRVCCGFDMWSQLPH